jgi:hypothetical protein
LLAEKGRRAGQNQGFWGSDNTTRIFVKDLYIARGDQEQKYFVTEVARDGKNGMARLGPNQAILWISEISQFAHFFATTFK